MTDKVTIERATLEQAIDALECSLSDSRPYIVKSREVSTTLRAALAARPAETVAWMPIESSPKDGAWMYVWRKHGTFPIQAKYNIKYAWFEDDDANHLYNLTHWMPLPAAPGAAPPAPVPPEPIAEMDAVAIKYAHKMALDLECILAEYGGSWYNTAMQTLGEYRSAMNAIHERESPTFMGEPVTAAGDKP